MFQTTAWAVHSGVASPDQEKLSTKILHNYCWHVSNAATDRFTCVVTFACYMYTVTVSPLIFMFTHSFLLPALFLRSLSDFSGDLSHFVCAVWEKDRQSSCLWHSRLFDCCQDRSRKQKGQTGTGSVSWVLLAFAKEQVLLDQRGDIL